MISVKSIACGRAYRGKDRDPDYKRPAGRLFRVKEQRSFTQAVLINSSFQKNSDLRAMLLSFDSGEDDARCCIC